MNDKIENLGLGVLISMLGGNEETVNSIKASVGKTIVVAALRDDNLVLTFTDGTRLILWDDGQSCCESRYMMTDDKLEDFAGSTLLGFELKEAPNIPSDYDCPHEVQFLDVKTSKGVFQMATHNEHNGYYGGFSIKARLGDNA